MGRREGVVSEGRPVTFENCRYETTFLIDLSIKIYLTQLASDSLKCSWHKNSSKVTYQLTNFELRSAICCLKVTIIRKTKINKRQYKP